MDGGGSSDADRVYLRIAVRAICDQKRGDHFSFCAFNCGRHSGIYKTILECHG